MDAIALGFAALLLTVASGAVWFRAMNAVRLPENRSGFVALWACAGVFGALAIALGPGWIGGIPAVLAIVGATFFLFTVLISRQQVPGDVITVGATLPQFSAPDEDGQTFDSAGLAGHPVLIKFFRGHW